LLCTLKIVSGLVKPGLIRNINNVTDLTTMNENIRVINNTFDDVYLKLQKPENVTIYTTTPTVTDLNNGQLVFYYSGTLYGIAVKMNNTVKYFKSN